MLLNGFPKQFVQISEKDFFTGLPLSFQSPSYDR